MRFSERDKARTQRQEEYEDYTERNINGGWPYSDEAGAQSEAPGNRPYGDLGANFDRERNDGMHDAADPVPDSTDLETAPGGETPAERDDAMHVARTPKLRALGDRGVAGHRGKGPRGYRRSDERIREDVSDLLTEEARLDPSDLDVTVEGGQVLLEGRVSEDAERELAETLAWQVIGVAHVENSLTVGPPEL
ncbi:BON domain-containing protein [Pararhizobium mangrovi]|nr:BON domain-containing protein [Pararhizobium mangrovi]